MTDDRMPPQDDPRLEAYLRSLAEAPVPADLAGSVSTGIHLHPARRPSFRLPILTAAAGLLLVVSVAMAAGWQPPFDLLPGPQASPAPTGTAPTPSSSPGTVLPGDDGTFARVVTAGAELRTEPGGGELIATVSDEDLWTEVLVLGRAEVDGRAWSRVEWQGPDGSIAFGWLEETVASSGPTGYRVPVLERDPNPPCPAPGGFVPAEVLQSLTPALRLSCLGDESFSVGPVMVEDGWQGPMDEGSPAWLAGPSDRVITGTLQAGEPFVLGPLRIRPELDLRVPAGQWVRLTGHYDDGAAMDCRRSPTRPDAPVGDAVEQVLWCRQQLVVTGWNVDLDPRVPIATPGSGGVLEGTRQSLPMAPLAGRLGQSAVMAGSQLVIWGGEVNGGEWPAPDGATIDVFGDREWVPMSRSPLSPRRDALAAWTGTEVLLWGGHDADGRGLADGAAWDPATDRWRALPAAPVDPAGLQAAAWAGDRWMVLSGTSLAAYDPATDAWVAGAPPPLGPGIDTPGLAWTGDELFLTTHEWAGDATWTLRPGGDWEPREPPPACWTPLGQPVIGNGLVMILGLRRPGDCQSETTVPSLAVWSPETDAWRLVDAPSPPDNRGTIAWTGSRLVVQVPEGVLAWSPTSEAWAELPGYGEDRLRDGPSLLAALDRVIVWGGGFFDHGDPQPDGGEYILGTGG